MIFLPNVQKSFRVVFSIDIKKSRCQYVYETVKSLLKSSIDVDMIYIHTPYNTISSNLLDFTNEPKVTINFCPSFGCLTKLIPTLMLEENPNTLIMTVDDDIPHPSNYHEVLLTKSIEYPRHAFGYCASNGILQTRYGVVTRRGFFDEFFSPNDTYDVGLTLDIFIDQQLETKNIKKTVIS